MDIFSHVLISRALATPPKNSRKNIYIITFFSYLADFPQTATYIYLGIINARPYFFPFNSDWDGVRELHPYWSALWEIPHSLFFAFLIILPIVLYYKLPKMAFVAYLAHIFIDTFTHAGEWGTRIFYPFKYQINGFTDAWTWSFQSMLLSWAALFTIILLLHFFFRLKNKKNF